MATTLRWIISQSASCCYAADQLRRNRSANDSPLARAVREPLEQLQAEIEAAALPEERFWQYLVPLSVTIPSNRQLSETVLKKTLGIDPRVELLTGRLAGHFAELEGAVYNAVPSLVDDLTTQAEVCRDSWKAKIGPLLSLIGQQTDPQVVVPEATVAVVAPVCGGGGAAHIYYNSVCFELVPNAPADARVANSQGSTDGGSVSGTADARQPTLDGTEIIEPALPELWRLVWLLGQLNFDLPLMTETIPAERHTRLAAVAMLMATLTALEQIRQARCDQETVSTAAQLWMGEDPHRANSLAQAAMQWWTTYAETRPGWNVAVAALERMLPWDAAMAS